VAAGLDGVVLLAHAEGRCDGERAPEADTNEGLKGGKHLHGLMDHQQALNLQ
jgi:hypothetical protein